MGLLHIHGLYNSIEFVQANFSNSHQLAQAMEGSDYVIHTASPTLKSEPKGPNDFIKPAIDQTLAICKAASIAEVKRLVLVSSISAVAER